MKQKYFFLLLLLFAFTGWVHGQLQPFKDDVESHADFQQNNLESKPIQSLKNALLGWPLHYEIAVHPFNRSGRGAGILTGGNLAMLAHLTGSNSQVNTSGKILFIEDVGEYLYNTDRLLVNLKRSGQLSELSGLIVGSFTDMQDTERPFGQTVEEIIWDKVKEYDYPVLFRFPCGHQEDNVTLQLGMRHELLVDEKSGNLKCQFFESMV